MPQDCKQPQICEERFKTIFKRLDVIDKLIEKIQELSISVERLAQSSKAIVEENIKQNKRLDSIEAFGFKKYAGIAKMLVSAIIGGAIAYLWATNK